MSTHHRRLATLEAGAGLSPTWDERDIAALSYPSILTVGVEFARRIVQRRLHDDGLRWYLLDPDERHALTRAELRAGVAELRAAPDLHSGIRTWLAGAETLAALAWPAIDYSAFVEHLARDRASMDTCRGSDDRHAVEWRRRHPDWHPGMTAAESDRWEAAIGMAWARS